MKKKNGFIKFSFKSIDSVIDLYVLPQLSGIQVITFEGTLGAGKTTFIKHLIKKLGCNEVVTSPTFNYVNIYHAHHVVVQHFDLYRLESSFEFEELGLHESIGLVGTLSLIEWPSAACLSVEGLRKKGKVMALEFAYDPLNVNVRLLKIK